VFVVAVVVLDFERDRAGRVRGQGAGDLVWRARGDGGPRALAGIEVCLGDGAVDVVGALNLDGLGGLGLVGVAVRESRGGQQGGDGRKRRRVEGIYIDRRVDVPLLAGGECAGLGPDFDIDCARVARAAGCRDLAHDFGVAVSHDVIAGLRADFHGVERIGEALAGEGDGLAAAEGAVRDAHGVNQGLAVVGEGRGRGLDSATAGVLDVYGDLLGEVARGDRRPDGNAADDAFPVGRGSAAARGGACRSVESDHDARIEILTHDRDALAAGALRTGVPWGVVGGDGGKLWRELVAHAVGECAGELRGVVRDDDGVLAAGAAGALHSSEVAESHLARLSVCCAESVG